MKQNKKGFTLVELIVVMAIIAVLAAILVPTMLGFMNNAKITQANANAKSINTAYNAIVSDFATSHSVATLPATITVDATTLNTEVTWDTTYKFKPVDYIGSLEGKAFVKLNTSKTGVEFALWSLGDPGTDQKKASEQKAALSGGTDLIGCYPLKAE